MIEIIPNWHPIFVHFTVALITISALCYFIGIFSTKYSLGREFLIVGRWCLWFGAIAAIATVIAGFIAYYSVAHDTPSHLAMTEHRNWAIATFVVILFVTIWSLWQHFKKKSVGIMFVMAMIITFFLVTITAWHGAEVVYRYGIGVLSLPKSEGKGHQHSHDNKQKTSPAIHPNTKKHGGDKPHKH